MYDKAKIWVEGGARWGRSSSFRREAHVPRGCSDGGHGGDVVLVCDASRRNLGAVGEQDFRAQRGAVTGKAQTVMECPGDRVIRSPRTPASRHHEGRVDSRPSRKGRTISEESLSSNGADCNGRSRERFDRLEERRFPKFRACKEGRGDLVSKGCLAATSPLDRPFPFFAFLDDVPVEPDQSLYFRERF